MVRSAFIARMARCALVASPVLIAPTLAASQTSEYAHIYNLTESHGMVMQRMTAEVLFVALDVDRERNLGRLTVSRNEFDRAMKGFRDGDAELRIPKPRTPGLRDEIVEAQEIWTSMDAAISQIIAGNSLTVEQIGAVADLGESLRVEVSDFTEMLRESSDNDMAYTMLDSAIETVGQTRTLSQRLTKEFLLVAYGHQPDRYRSSLNQSTRLFEDALLGLQVGDFDRQLLPAPTPEIKEQLALIEQIWTDAYRPLVERAMRNEPLAVDAVADMALANLRLYRAIDAVAEMYGRL